MSPAAFLDEDTKLRDLSDGDQSGVSLEGGEVLEESESGEGVSSRGGCEVMIGEREEKRVVLVDGEAVRQEER